MKPNLCGRLVALLLLGMCFCLPSAAQNAARPTLTPEQRAWIAAHPVVRYTTERGWRPLIDVEEGRPVGLIPAYLDSLAKKTGLRFEYVPSSNWKEAMTLFYSGKIDMLPGITAFHLRAFPSRPQLSRTYLSGAFVIVGRADEPIAFSLDDLAGRRVAMFVREQAMVPMEDLAQLQIVSTRSVEEGLQAVVDGRADYLIGLDAVHHAFVRRRFIGKLGVAGLLNVPPLEAKMAYPAGHDELRAVMDWAIGDLTAEETDVLFEKVAVDGGYGAPTLRSLWRYRAFEMVAFTVLLVSLLVLAVISRRARRQARLSEAAKSRFLAMMSHEIRTPINVIVGSLEVLENQSLPDPIQRVVATMSRAGHALTDLLDNVLDLSKLEAGKVALERTAVNPRDLVQSVTQLMEGRAEVKGIQLRLDLDALGMGSLQLDAIRLRQVLSNLIGNAIKFTEQGEVTISARRDQAEGQAWLRVDVRDTGIGIAPADQAKLFQPYVQADDTSTRGFGGTGLGLAICRELVELMGGHIWLTSEPGRGTEISLRIPWIDAPAVPDRRPKPTSEDWPASLAHLEILVCDDNPLNLQVISQQLRQLGAHVVPVASGPEALAVLQVRSVDLVLMDCHMPGMDGYTTAKRIRAEIDETLPVFAVSAASEAAHLQRCTDAGMSGVLRKPVRTQELLGLIALWGLSDGTRAVGSEQGPEHLEDESFAPRPFLIEDLAGLQKAMADGDLQAAAHHAHRIKGSAAIFSMTAVEDAAIQFEQGLAAQGVTASTDALARTIHSLPE